MKGTTPSERVKLKASNKIALLKKLVKLCEDEILIFEATGNAYIHKAKADSVEVTVFSSDQGAKRILVKCDGMSVWLRGRDSGGYMGLHLADLSRKAEEHEESVWAGRILDGIDRL